MRPQPAVLFLSLLAAPCLTDRGAHSRTTRCTKARGLPLQAMAIRPERESCYQTPRARQESVPSASGQPNYENLPARSRLPPAAAGCYESDALHGDFRAAEARLLLRPVPMPWRI